MVEPKAEDDLLASFASVKAVVSAVGEKSLTNLHGAYEPYFLDPPTHLHHIASYHGPGDQIEKIVALEAELQRLQDELSHSKEQLAVSDIAKVQALKDLTNTKNLLDQISHIEHFAASDNAVVHTTSLPPSWEDDSNWHFDTALAATDTAAREEIDRLCKELEASKTLNARYAAELDSAKQQNDWGSFSIELDNAKKDITALQAAVSDAWSHHGTCALDLARAKEEIAWLEADLEAAQNLTVELAHAKGHISALQEDLEAVRGLQKTCSIELLKSKEEISRLRSLHEVSSSELVTAMETNGVLRADLEDVRSLRKTSSMDLLKARDDYETATSERVNAEEEIRRLQAELSAALVDCRSSATELKGTRLEIDKLQKELNVVMDQYGSSCTELSEARKQIKKLSLELECVQGKYESDSSELSNAREHVLRLEGDQLEIRDRLSADIEIRQQENLKLQTELATFQSQKISLTAEVAEVRGEIKYLREQLGATGERYRTASDELLSARKDISRLESELSAIERQHGDCFRSLEALKKDCMKLQTELTKVQELHTNVSAELVSARNETTRLQRASTEGSESSVKEIKGLKEEIGRLHSDLLLQKLDWESEKSLACKRMDDLMLELVATKEHLEKATAARLKAELELAGARGEAAVASTLRLDIAAVRAELIAAREAESKLEWMELELEELKSQMTVKGESIATALSSELSAELDALKDAFQKSEARYQELFDSSQSQTESLKTQLCAARDSEGKTKESLITTIAELQKAKVDLVIMKEALEWVGGDAAALSAQVEAFKAEVTTTKEGEPRAKAAFLEYSQKLQRMRLELEDASKLADKVPTKAQARTFKLDLDEANENLLKVTESERTMSGCMASLSAELKNAKRELSAVREEKEAALAEKEKQIDLELSQMRAQWEAAVNSEKLLTNTNSTLNESLVKVMTEAEETKFAEGKAKEEADKARQELEQAQAHIDTLEARLQAVLLEVEAVKASEEWALAQIKLKLLDPGLEIEEEQGSEVAGSPEEHHIFSTKADSFQDLASKRVAMGMAQVDAAKASEREMQMKLEALESELSACRAEFNEAVKKREESEAAKFAVEAMLRQYRGERKSLSHSGALNGGQPMGKLMGVGDRQGSINSISLENSQSSSPSRSSFSFASFGSPGRHENSPVRSIAHVLTTKMPSEEKQRKLRFSKFGSYFSKWKDSSPK